MLTRWKRRRRERTATGALNQGRSIRGSSIRGAVSMSAVESVVRMMSPCAPFRPRQSIRLPPLDGARARARVNTGNDFRMLIVGRAPVEPRPQRLLPLHLSRLHLKLRDRRRRRRRKGVAMYKYIQRCSPRFLLKKKKKKKKRNVT